MLLSLITKNLKCAGSLKIRFIEGESRKTNILEGIA